MLQLTKSLLNALLQISNLQRLNNLTSNIKQERSKRALLFFFLYLRFNYFYKNTMSLKCGIVRLPNVGKSTLFNCISSSKAQAANFPFCTIEPNIGSTTVPDDRLQALADIVHPGRIGPATVEIVDIAGLVKGASKGE